MSRQNQNPYSHVLLITGSRTWAEKTSITSDYTVQAYLDLTYDALSKVWAHWGSVSPAPITKPLLISGNCPQGADALLEKIWAQAGHDVVLMPADWNAHGKRAGFLRNEAMVNEAKLYRAGGSVVAAAAFLDVCGKIGCPQRELEQLMPQHMGHFSHGTIHCRSSALSAGIPTLDVISPPPF